MWNTKGPRRSARLAIKAGNVPVRPPPRIRDPSELPFEAQPEFLIQIDKTFIPPSQLAMEAAVIKAYKLRTYSWNIIGGRPTMCIVGKPSSESQRLGMIFTHGNGIGDSSQRNNHLIYGFSVVAPIFYFEQTTQTNNLPKKFHTILEYVQPDIPRALGGIGIGASAAAIAAQETDKKVEALVLMSYPLRPGKDDFRDQVLLDIAKEIDVLFIVGEKDHICNIAELNSVRKKMKARSWLVLVAGVGHDLNRFVHWRSIKNLRHEIGQLAGLWLDKRDEKKKYYTIRMDAETDEVIVSDWTKGCYSRKICTVQRKIEVLPNT